MQSPNTANMPMNYFPEGAPTVFAELWFQTDMSVLGQECQNLEQKINGETLFFDNLGRYYFPNSIKKLVSVILGYFSISYVKITFYTEVLTRKVELCIFSQTTFLVKISV